MNLCRGSLIVSLALLVMLCATSAFAAVPLVTSYQGRLLDGADKPLSGSYTMVFQIYDAPVGGALLWTEDHVSVQVTDGLFTVALGATVPLSAELLAGNGGGGGGGGIGRYLQIQIAGQPPISPRTPLTASPMSVASSSVSGDVVTAPGALHMFDADSASTIDLGTELIAGKKVAKFKAGAEMAGTVNKREIAVSAGDDSASISIDEPGVHRMMISSSGGSGGSGGQVSLRVSNTCCLGSSGQDGVGLVSDESSNSISVIRLNGLPPGTPVLGKVVISAANDSGSVVVGDPNIASVVSSVGNLAGGGGGAAAASYAATGRMTPSGLDQVMTRVDESGPSIAIDESGVHVARTAANNDSTYSELSGRRPGRVKYGEVHISSGATRSSLHVKFQDGDIPTGQDRFVSVSADSAAGTILLEADTDGDGVMDNSVSSSSSSTGAKHAINTKGTGSAGRTVRATTDSIAAASSVEADLDGDDVAENSIASIADATGSRMAIKTKGTGAEANKSASLTVTGSPGGNAISAVCATDVDGDGTPENFSSQICNADSVYHEVSVTAPQPGGEVALMKAKEKANRTKCSSSLRYSAPSSSSGKDDDCDGFSASRSLFFDNDGDGAPENGIQEVCLPTSSSMAIKTKGTGADKNRAASFACIADVDGDGTVDRQVSTTADSTTAGIAIDEPGVHIAAEARKGWDGTIKGRIAIDEGGAQRVLFDSDGNGFLSGKVGIGVSSPVHLVDVSGGAYCDGTNWVNASDVNSKENFQTVNGSELLDQIEQLAITRWNYKGNSQAEHIGPTAQDFKAAFGVGADDKSISTIDPSGIALAAIKALRIESKNKTQQLNELQDKVQQLQALVERLLAEKK